MSNVYTSEPPTTGKVILITNYGNIDVELWTKEAPRACRNFIQHCLDGYYNNCIFHRIIKGFMIQTGDPTGTGQGGESIWGKDFIDEFHSRLKFSHRGLVAMANKNQPNTNGSQFFITLDKCSWLDRKHTIFGKVAGSTFFNALAIGELPTKNDYPLKDVMPVITETQVVINPFGDMKPRKKEENADDEGEDVDVLRNKKEDRIEFKDLGNVNLISFNDEDDIFGGNIGNKNSLKIKSSHELLKKDKKLKNVEIKKEDKESSLLDKKHKSTNEKEQINESIPIINKNREVKEEEPVANHKNTTNYREEIQTLKKEIQAIKNKEYFEENYTVDQSKQTDSDLPKKSLLQQQREKYLQLKTNRTTTKDTIDKITQFRNKLKESTSQPKEDDTWLSNKLKFHIDSQKAYNLDEKAKKFEKEHHLNINN